jgi:DNA modification methylase
MKRPIENNSRVGDAVYDPFVGSGTTIIASELTGRVALAMEIDPIYCDVVVLRWQTYAKGEARLEATGQTFTEVAAKRLPKEKGTGQSQRPAVGASAP